MRHRQAIAILVVALALLAAWRGALAWLGRAAEFGESNYQANRIRIERYLARPKAPEYVVLGSSLSGRLRPAAFAGSALSDVAVLGLDGSSPLLGIAVLAHRADLPRVALVETFAFNRGWKANDQLLLDGLAGPGMRLARADRLFAADQRPTSLLYSWFKERRDRAGSGSGPRTNEAVRVAGPAEVPGTAAAADLSRLMEDIRALRARGVEVVLVDVLAGEKRMPGERTGPDTAALVAREFGLRRIDLRREWFARGWEPGYTDLRHLDGPSADALARLLAESVVANK
ncbi:MAG: hypothetical protein DVB31_13885 [Verrucomicrobia bacterium]|nr:MAG: hypothetical protein DVB31_13885 [Verrucomicrobiota bacterium]